MNDEMLRRATEARNSTPSHDCSGFRPGRFAVEWVMLAIIVAIIVAICARW